MGVSSQPLASLAAAASRSRPLAEPDIDLERCNWDMAVIPAKAVERRLPEMADIKAFFAWVRVEQVGVGNIDTIA